MTGIDNEIENNKLNLTIRIRAHLDCQFKTNIRLERLLAYFKVFT